MPAGLGQRLIFVPFAEVKGADRQLTKGKGAGLHAVVSYL